MKKMNRATRNKSIALFLALTMAAASMTGCGSKDDNDEPASEINFADIAGNSNNTPAETTPAETEEQEPATEEESREGMYRSEITNEYLRRVPMCLSV